MISKHTPKIFLPEEMTVAAAVAAIVAVLAVRFDGFESIAGFVHQHEDWQIDEIFSVMLVLGLAAIVLLVRRSAQLKREINQRIGAEGETARSHAQLVTLNDELKLRERDISAKNFQLDVALNNISQGLCMHDADYRLVVSNRRFQEIYSLPDEAITPGVSFLRVLEISKAMGNYPDHTAQEIYAERQLLISQRRSGVFYQQIGDGRTIAIAYVPLADGGWVATHEDITERRQAEVLIKYMAHHDELTGLPNRVLFRDALEQALTAIPDSGPVALLCLDLDDFKGVNDTFGHPVGDTLLQAVADRLCRCVQDGDTVARLGGDEFAIVQAVGRGPEVAAALALRIRGVLSVPFDLGGYQAAIGVSIGIATTSSNRVDPDELLKQADLALYHAKADRLGAYRVFEPAMGVALQTRRTLEADLRQALARGELEVHYQPAVQLMTGRVGGFEALLRWHHPTRGMVPPSEFIPVAEESGLIGEIGAWVLKQACADAAGWSEALTVAVNLSAVQFRTRDLIQDIATALAEAGLPAVRLELEITETVMLLDTSATLATLQQLRGLGVRTALDDFGTGYSSLSYLHQFPFDKIKIDRSFIRDLAHGCYSGAIIRAVVQPASSLDMVTTAEGVETAEQLEAVRSAGITEVQGYVFSPPRPYSEIARVLATVSAAWKAAAWTTNGSMVFASGGDAGGLATKASGSDPTRSARTLEDLLAMRSRTLH